MVENDGEPDGASEHDLAQAGGQGHRAGRPDQVQIQLESDDEEQQRDADLGQQRDLIVAADDAQKRRAGQNAGGQKHDDQRLAQPLAHDAQQGRQAQDGRNFEETATVGHIYPFDGWPACSMRTQLSLRVTVRLKTSCPGALSLASVQK
jgi:hypothetical protein